MSSAPVRNQIDQTELRPSLKEWGSEASTFFHGFVADTTANRDMAVFVLESDDAARLVGVRAPEIEEIRDLAMLQDNWDGYGAKRIPRDVIEKAVALALSLQIRPRVFPTGRQSIQFEFEAKEKYMEVEIDSGGYSVLIELPGENDSEWETSDPASVVKAVAGFDAATRHR